VSDFRSGVARELRRWRRDRVMQALLLWLPLAAFALLLGIFSARSATDLPIAVIDRDNSAPSRALVAQLDAAAALRVALRTASMGEARAAMERGAVYAVVEIPRHFRRDVLRGARPQVGLLLNQQAMSAANAVARDVQAVVLSAAAHQSAALRAAGGTPLKVAAAQTQPLRVQTHALFNPGIDYAAYLGIALLAAALHCFVVLHGARCLASESDDWHARSTPGARLAKLLPAFAWWSLCGALWLALAYHLLGLPPVSAPLLLYSGWVLLVIAYLGLGAALAAWLAPPSAYSLVSALSAPAMAFSGITFPLGAMPLAPRMFGEALPLTWFLHLQTELVTERLPAALALHNWLRLLAFAIALGLAALLALRHRHRQSRQEQP